MSDLAMRRWSRWGILCGLGVLGGACTDGTPAEPDGHSDSAVQGQSPAIYALEESPRTTLQQVWRPLAPTPEVEAQIASGELRVTELDRFVAAGLGVELVDGHPWVEHDALAPGFEQGAPSARRSLAWMWQVADPQLMDEESPIRFEGFEGLFRPQGHLTVQAFEAHVRTAARVAELAGRPFDFAMVAGDMTDGSQRNELQWFIDVLHGGIIDPDSGVDDDPVPGPGNDHSDPFESVGLGAPWYAALGNHETQYNGGFGNVDEAVRDASVGEDVFSFPLFTNGFRDGSTEHGEVRTSGPTPADPDRLVLDRVEVLTMLQQASGLPEGHGLTPEAAAEGRGYFSTWPIDGVPLRLIVLDTVNTGAGTGLGAAGNLDVAQHAWLQQELIAADAAAELVIVMSHHRPSDILGGDGVSAEVWQETLASSQGLVMHVCGHVHHNESRLQRGAGVDDDAGYWELTLASTVDFPMQSRLFELVDEGNGFLSVYATNLDHWSPEGSLAHQARRLAAAKKAFGEILPPEDIDEVWLEDVPAQNLLLRWQMPSAVADRVAGHGHEVIVSESVLATW